MNNVVVLNGNIGRDPDIRYTSAGKPVVNLSVATKDKMGETENTEWHRCVCFGRVAEKCSRIKKGERVFIIGRIQTRKWEKDGKPQYTTEIVAEHVQFADFEAVQDRRDEPVKNTGDDDSIPF